MSTTRAQEIDAFLQSAHAQSLGGATPEQAREVLERFLLCLEQSLDGPLASADPRALHVIVGHMLPDHYAIGDPLAEVTGPVLEAWLEFEKPNLPPKSLPVLQEMLRGTLPEFVEAVRTGEAVHHGLAGHDHAHGAHGASTFVREMPKVGRNEPCPCGSGKKFKACHGRG